VTIFLAITNSSGGSGKTTTAHALAVACAEYGRRTLLVDFDPGAQLTYLLKVENPRSSVVDVLREQSYLDSSIHSTSERFSFLPSDSRLSHLNFNKKTVAEVSSNFRKACQESDPAFDLVILDCASSVSVLSLLTFAIADYVLAPFVPTLHGARGVLQSLEISRSEVTSSNAGSQWLGALPILIGSDSSEIDQLLSSEVKIMSPSIPKSRTVPDSSYSGKSVLNFAPQGSVALAYRELAYFLLEEMQESKNSKN
jgi:chromosome partitioning protein